VTHHSCEIKENFDALENQTVTIAGRMMSKRVMGKASFCNVQDKFGSISATSRVIRSGEDAYKAFKKLDIGDIIGIKGFPFKTKTGEITIHAEELTLLSKSLKPLPEKFHGLTGYGYPLSSALCGSDYEPGSQKTFIKRSQIIKEIRRFLDGRGFMEVETPILVDNAGGAAARPFVHALQCAQ
jgi:lysyl-tRNA synthetase class 2